MRFGIRLIEYLGDSHELLRLAVAAERAGVDSIWFPHDPFMRNTWALTSAAAVMTRRVQIGGVAINPYTTDPSEIATYVATLDELSAGRCILGLGLHTESMVAWTGRDTTHYMAVMREAVALIRRLLRGENAASDSPYFPWTDQCYLRFKPRRADVPIYMSSFGDDFHELAGEIGDGCQPMVTPPAGARHTVAGCKAILIPGAVMRRHDVGLKLHGSNRQRVEKHDAADLQIGLRPRTKDAFKVLFGKFLT